MHHYLQLSGWLSESTKRIRSGVGLENQLNDYGDPRHLIGALAEIMAAEILTRNGFYVFVPLRKTGPVDLFAIHPDGRELKLDIKTDRSRKPAGNRKKPTRIHRARTDTQKELGVIMAYVDIEKRTLHISGSAPTPPTIME